MTEAICSMTRMGQPGCMAAAGAYLLHERAGRGSIPDAVAFRHAVHEPDHDAVVIEQSGDLQSRDELGWLSD